MRRLAPALFVVAALSAAACKKSQPEEAAPPPGPLAVTDHAPTDEEAESTEIGGGGAVHGADALLAQGQDGALAVPVDAARVEKYLTYRRQVVSKGQSAVAKFQKDTAVQPAAVKGQASAVKTVRAAEEFAVRMRAIEEQALRDLGLSREEAGAVAQVVGAVLSERQMWKMSGGDAAIEQARAKLLALSGDERARAEAALKASEAGFAQAKAAGTSRRRFGDAAVDAVLAHEDALWTLQKEGMSVMAQVH